MNTPIPPAPAAVPPLVPAPSTGASSGKRLLLWGLGSLFALFIVIGATIAVTIWWIQRPITPVVLSSAEKSAVEEKLRVLGGAEAPETGQPFATGSLQAEAEDSPALSARAANLAKDRPYAPGSKELKLTERELNGLLNANTDLGKTIRLEFGRDAINAYLVVPIPEDFPIGGGKMFRARGRFSVSLGNGGDPFAILEDVTVFGLSLPKAWLGGVKGENLLSNVVGTREGAPILHGIKSLQVRPGALVIQVQD